METVQEVLHKFDVTYKVLREPFMDLVGDWLFWPRAVKLTCAISCSCGLSQATKFDQMFAMFVPVLPGSRLIREGGGLTIPAMDFYFDKP